MPSGGKRRGAGRPFGTGAAWPKRVPGTPRPKMRRLAAKDIEEVRAKGDMLPHQWLLHIAAGHPIEHNVWVDVRSPKTGKLTGEQVLTTKMVYPDIEMRVDAAKAAAPYYAPRLATSTFGLGTGGNTDAAVKLLQDFAAKLPV